MLKEIIMKTQSKQNKNTSEISCSCNIILYTITTQIFSKSFVLLFPVVKNLLPVSCWTCKKTCGNVSCFREFRLSLGWARSALAEVLGWFAGETGVAVWHNCMLLHAYYWLRCAGWWHYNSFPESWSGLHTVSRMSFPEEILTCNNDWFKTIRSLAICHRFRAS